MSNNNQSNKQDSSNISPMFTIPPSPITSIPPPPSPAAFYQSYMQAAAMYAFHQQQQQQQQFFQHMFSVPPPPLPTSNISTGNRPSSLLTDNSQRRSTDVRQLSISKTDYQDRKRNIFSSSSSLRDNNNKNISNKRLYNFDQSSRNDDRNIPRREPSILSPVSKRRRINNNKIEDEYHDSSSDEEINNVSITKTKPQYVRTCTSELYYRRDEQNSRLIHATQKLKDLCEKFRSDVLVQREKFRKDNKIFDEPDHSNMFHKAKQISSNIKSNKSQIKSKDVSSESGEEDEDEEEEEEGEEEGEATAASLASDNLLTLEIERKQQVSDRLHPELWFNEYKQGNDGPVCRCSNDDRKFGIRHQMFYGEKSISPCDKWNNNAGRLFHYRITLTPETNFVLKEPTVITYDDHDYIFEGFSVLSHVSLANVNDCIVVYHNIDYAIGLEEETPLEHYTIEELDLLQQYLLIDVCELYDIQWQPLNNNNNISTCTCYHFFPRFARILPDNGKELLHPAEQIQYFLKHLKPLMPNDLYLRCKSMSVDAWDKYVSKVQGSIVWFPKHRPAAIRLDQLDRENSSYPVIVHFGIRPAVLSIQYNQEYRQAYKSYLKVFFLLKNRTPTDEDKANLRDKEQRLKQIVAKHAEQLKREIVVEISSEYAYRTGFKSDIIQRSLLLSSLHDHLRFHQSLTELENQLLGYQFHNRWLMQLALTHPSGNYVLHNNLGPNPDHVKNTLANCRIRNTVYGDRKQLFRPITKRGVSTLFKIMAKKAKTCEHISEITNYERLEFLGDALLELLVSIHLFFLFPQFDEGRLSTFRVGLIQNHFFTSLARNLCLQHFIIYNHGPDLCSHSALNHALANSFEALMGAIYLDGGLAIVDKILSKILFYQDKQLTDIWNNLQEYPLKIQYPNSDRHLIEQVPLLKQLTKFEQDIGVEFQHIRMLAQAFCTRPIPQNDLTIEDNERLEFLGDTVLNFVVSDYLYRHFPEHHEGHLSLLRSCTVSNPTQAVIYDELGMQVYVDYVREQLRITTPKLFEKSLKAKADVFEAFIAALFIDQGLESIYAFCRATIFPRLQDFISTQHWNDPKSNLQHCCLALRDPNDRNPPLPEYRVLKSIGSSNNVQYKVGVFFRKQRLSVGIGRSIHDAEMTAAKNALEQHAQMFPLLNYQKSVLASSNHHHHHHNSKRRIATTVNKNENNRQQPFSLRNVKTRGDVSSMIITSAKVTS
ncbi:unnamed protein product [Rotaria sp. Silwood1]|nr:unnamed protein product [Rotaria sp. Silwood1]